MGYFKIKKTFNDIITPNNKVVDKNINPDLVSQYELVETEIIEERIEKPEKATIKKQYNQSGLKDLTDELPPNIIVKKGGKSTEKIIIKKGSVVVNNHLKYLKTNNNNAKQPDNRKIGVDNERTEKVAILVHCYFIDVLLQTVLPKLLPLSKYADFYFNFIKNGDTVNQTMAIEVIKNNFDNYTINYTEKNVGRDINGQFNNLKSLYKKGKSYDFYFFVHTKKSTHLNKKTAQAWVDDLLSETVGDYDTINNVLDDFGSDEKLGLFGSQSHLHETLKFMFYDNKEKYNEICEILGIDKNTRSYFIGGTFFWSRSEIIDYYFKNTDNLNIISSKFTETGLLDGDWHHAMERMYGTMCYNLGYTVNHKNIN